MNERICNNIVYNLAKEAGLIEFEKFDWNPELGSPTYESVMKARKFAELIVKEYEKLLPEICPWADADKEGPMKGWHVEFVARKHFGVQE